MDAGGNIYELTPEDLEAMDKPTPESEILKQDVARLDGFMRGAAQAGRKSHEKLVWDSKKQGPYRKDSINAEESES